MILTHKTPSGWGIKRETTSINMKSNKNHVDLDVKKIFQMHMKSGSMQEAPKSRETKYFMMDCLIAMTSALVVKALL